MNLIIENLNLPEPPPAGEKLVYVLLHGLVAIVETSNSFILYMLNMETDHKYIGGHWLAERDIPQGTKAVLTGVKPGNASLDPKANPVIRLDGPIADSAAIYATLTVPKPRRLYSLDRGRITIRSGAEHLVGIPETLSGLRILEYEITDFLSNVGVASSNTSFAWTPANNSTSFDNGSAIAALHIYDMPAGEVPPGHHVAEFLLGSTVMGKPLELDDLVISLPDAPADVPPGLSPLEISVLGARNEEISDLVVDFIRNATWRPSTAVSDTCRACCGSPDGSL